MARTKKEIDTREICLINWGGKKDVWIANLTIDDKPSQLKETTQVKLRNELKKLYGLDLAQTFEKPLDKIK